MEKSGTRRLSLKQRLEGAIKMVERKETGKSVQEISNEINSSSKHLYKLEAKYKAGQPLEDEPRSGRSKKSLLRLRAGLLEVPCLNLFKAQNKSSQK